MPDPSSFEFEMAVEKLYSQVIRYWSNPSRLIKAGGRKSRSEILKFSDSTWNKEELPEEWKESLTVHIYKKGDKTDRSNYRRISHLSTTYKILSNILLWKLTP
jgi:hypothetical protein